MKPLLLLSVVVVVAGCEKPSPEEVQQAVTRVDYPDAVCFFTIGPSNRSLSCIPKVVSVR